MSQDVVDWRIVLCDNDGQYISILDGIAQDVVGTFKMCRTDSITFNVPSDHPLVNTLMSDGLPYLACGKRSIKAYRKVGSMGTWVLRFAGRIWNLEDQGDGDRVRTQVTAFDPLKILEKRLVRDKDGAYWIPCKWYYPPTATQPPPDDDDLSGISGSKVIKDMIERSRKFGGMPPGGSSTGTNMSPVHIETGGFGWPEETWADTAGFDFQTEAGSYIMPYIVQICNTGTVDLTKRYLDVFDGVFIHVGSTPRLGSDKSGSVSLNYAATPFSASQFDRTQALDDLANYIHLWGKKQSGQKGIAYDATSQLDYLVMEQAENMTDLTDEAVLQYLADLRLKLQKDPRDMVTVVPTPEASPLPWDDYYLGDTISVVAATEPYPVTRDIVNGAQRVYGIEVTLDNDYGEFVSQLVVSAQDNAE